ncbi:phosphate regulon sensor histidine kinase PhoR [Polynucleobacter sp. UK-FUSCHL-C3]|uniref:Phosphate regulon sensor protein PhoR n=1 Tax=Polynucleobacter sp. UK-FUSCHL-C3 TaxID=2955208 RepID=A0AAU8A0I2_9BURK
MFYAIFRLITMFLVAGIAGVIGRSLLGEIAGWLIAFSILAYSLLSAYINQERLDVFAKGAGVSSLSGFGPAWSEIFFRLQRIITGLRKDIEQIERQHKRFIEAFQASPNGIVMLDDQDQIEWCNAIAEQFLGLQFKRDALQRIHYIVRKPEFVQYMMSRQYEEPVVLEKMGSASSLILRLQVFPFSENRRLILIQDITDLSKAEAMRRDFVANVSHEMRTPLTVMMGFLETVQTLELPPEQKAQYLEMMMDQGKRMKNLVEDLLTLANLEANTQPAPINSISMSYLMSLIKNDAYALSQGKHSLNFDLKTPCNLLGEEREVLSAFSNLVSNAIRYTPNVGSVSATWSVNAAGEGEFSVTDTGPGISPEHIPRLTERFYRIDRSRSRETGGTGLGLAIVKHVANRHQANLVIESTPGRGSTFTLRFPPARTS